MNAVPCSSRPPATSRPASQEQVSKLRAEREVLAGDVAVLRADLDTTRQERDRLLGEFNKAKAETDRIRWGAAVFVCGCL